MGLLARAEGGEPKAEAAEMIVFAPVPPALSQPIVATQDRLATTCRTFRDTAPRSASDSERARQPTPIFWGSVRLTIVDSCNRSIEEHPN